MPVRARSWQRAANSASSARSCATASWSRRRSLSETRTVAPVTGSVVRGSRSYRPMDLLRVTVPSRDWMRFTQRRYSSRSQRLAAMLARRRYSANGCALSTLRGPMRARMKSEFCSGSCAATGAAGAAARATATASAAAAASAGMRPALARAPTRRNDVRMADMAASPVRPALVPLRGIGSAPRLRRACRPPCGAGGAMEALSGRGHGAPRRGAAGSAIEARHARHGSRATRRRSAAAARSPRTPLPRRLGEFRRPR